MYNKKYISTFLSNEKENIYLIDLTLNCGGS